MTDGVLNIMSIWDFDGVSVADLRKMLDEYEATDRFAVDEEFHRSFGTGSGESSYVIRVIRD